MDGAKRKKRRYTARSSGIDSNQYACFLLEVIAAEDALCVGTAVDVSYTISLNRYLFIFHSLLLIFLRSFVAYLVVSPTKFDYDFLEGAGCWHT